MTPQYTRAGASSFSSGPSRPRSAPSQRHRFCPTGGSFPCSAATRRCVEGRVEGRAPVRSVTGSVPSCRRSSFPGSPRDPLRPGGDTAHLQLAPESRRAG
ncbi:hypothetical protein NDU88_009520 [Pleurodeles waltl]|uniref:Uncharacterized protein n=1 Tax=Pleurodeles waltl TaxID=8319 RepID=A0AAV7PSD1_PLEWA|nr:hypothetical protein NDU88_009520 [Pleurodeles waltl]